MKRTDEVFFLDHYLDIQLILAQHAIDKTYIYYGDGGAVLAVSEIGKDTVDLAIEEAIELSLMELCHKENILYKIHLTHASIVHDQNRSNASTLVEFIFFEACKHGRLDVLRTVLPSIADITIPYNRPSKCIYGATCLMLAAVAGRLQIVNYLLSNYQQLLHMQSPEGFTALHFGSAFCRPEIVNILLEAGANPEGKNKQGLIASEIIGYFAAKHSLKYTNEINFLFNNLHVRNRSFQRLSTYISHDICVLPRVVEIMKFSRT